MDSYGLTWINMDLFESESETDSTSNLSAETDVRENYVSSPNINPIMIQHSETFNHEYNMLTYFNYYFYNSSFSENTSLEEHLFKAIEYLKTVQNAMGVVRNLVTS